MKPKTFNCPVENQSVHKYLFEVNTEYFRLNRLSEFEPYYNHEEAKDLVSKDRAFRGKIRFKQGLNSFAVIESDDFVKNVFCSGMALNRAIHGSEVIFCPIGNDWQKYLVINQTEASKNFKEIERLEVLSEEQNQYNFLKKRFSDEAATEDVSSPIYAPDKIFAQIIYIEKNPLQEVPFVLRLKKDKQNSLQGHNIKSNKYPPFKIVAADKSSKLEINMHHYYLAKFEKWQHNEKQPTASLLEDLGEEGEIETEIQAILRMNDITLSNLSEEQVHLFKQQHGLDQSDGFLITDDELSKREDLRGDLIFAVGPREASGQQQAYSVTQQEDGSITLGVHIIDASSYIQKDSVFDAHAAKRAKSLKLPDRFARIFPEFINQEVCSFELSKERLALSIIFTINSQGSIQTESTRLCRSVVSCKSVFNFEIMEAIFMGQISATENTEFQDLKVKGCTVQEIVKSVNILKNLMNLRRNKKHEGSFSFEVHTSSEKVFTIDPITHKPTAWEYRKVSEAEKVIKECQNIANI